MRCSISAASSLRPSLRASSARLVSSRIAVRMSLMLWGSRMFTGLPFVVDWPLYEGYPRSTPPEQLVAQPHHRVVLAVRCAFLHRNQRVVGDLDVLGAHLGAALGDVAVAEALRSLRELLAVGARIQRVHVQ